MAGVYWTATEDATLQANAGKLSDQEIGHLLGRSRDSVRNRRRWLGRNIRRSPVKRTIWTAERRALLAQHYGKMRNAELAALIGCTIGGLKRAAHRDGLQAKAGSRLEWTPERVRTLDTLFGPAPTSEVAKHLGTTQDAVRHAARRCLGTNKSGAQRRNYARQQAAIDRLRILLAGALELVPADRVAAALGVPLDDLATARAREAVRGVRLVQERERRATASEATP